VEQKGIAMIASILNSILDMDIQIVMLGTGEKWAEGFFSQTSHQRSNFAVHVGYSDALAHKIEAGSDMFLMPSLFEPCGLNQIYSLRYGTLPIVRATGGLDDTIHNYDEFHESGNGFKFYEASNDALYHSIKWAVDVYYNSKDSFVSMQKRAMSEHFGWDSAALEYVDIYKNILGK